MACLRRGGWTASGESKNVLADASAPVRVSGVLPASPDAESPRMAIASPARRPASKVEYEHLVYFTQKLKGRRVYVNYEL